MKKLALIIGITSQDGAYLSKYLLEKGYEVIGTARNLLNINKLKYLKIDKEVQIIKIDLFNEGEIYKLFRSYKFNEIYNLDSNTFTKINNNYKENNESRKLSEEDLGTFNSYQSGSNAICKFHYDLIISNEFRCQLRGSNFICDWLKNIPK